MFSWWGYADKDPSQLADVGEGLKRYESNEALMADPDVDVVLIAANNNQHHDLVLQAARAGKDVLCEKPVAMSLSELDDMEAVCKECGVKFTVHHQRRFDPDFRTAKEVYDSGTLGDVYTIKSSLYGFNGNMHDWHVYKSEGGRHALRLGRPPAGPDFVDAARGEAEKRVCRYPQCDQL